jgi:peptide deformylase
MLIEKMKDTMRSAPGVGLAAPQIGLNISLAVIEDPAERLKDISEAILKDRGREPVEFHVIVNPVIVEKKGKINYFFEGCLSVKGKVRVTPRYDHVVVHCLDEKGNDKIIEASGWYARILQHEIDHLNGQLYVDIANERSEMIVDDAFKEKWMNADSEKIRDFFKSVENA